MIIYAACDSLGNITHTAQFDMAGLSLPDSHILPDELAGVALERLYFDGVAFITRPERPSVDHVPDGAGWIKDVAAMTQRIRAERDYRLAVTDWTQLTDIPASTKAAWTAYRQALRDVTNQPDLANIAWPVPPA